MNITKIILATLSGVAAGLAIGILVAPDKGSATRKRMGEKGNHYINDLKSEVKEFRKKVDKESKQDHDPEIAKKP